MSITIADIARQAFDAVAAGLGGVIKVCTLARSSPGGYDTETGDVALVQRYNACRAVFGRADAGAKYLPDYAIKAPEELVFIEGAAAMPPLEGDELRVTGGVTWRVMTARDIAQGAGLWAAAVRPL